MRDHGFAVEQLQALVDLTHARAASARQNQPGKIHCMRSVPVTTRGMREPEMAAIADMISEVLMDIKNVDAGHSVRQRVRELTARFPLPY